LKEWRVIHKIKALYDNGEGLKIRAIARQLGISRTTVKKYLKQDETVTQHQQSVRKRRQRLDAHRDYIIHLLKSFPGLSATKVLAKLRAKEPQLAISERTARRYISHLKTTLTVAQQRRYEPVLDMVPGVQCQVDGGELRGVRLGELDRTVYFVVFVLSYSRLMHVGLSRVPINTDTFVAMHDAAFRYFGGCPEECVYDQTKLVVLHEQYRELTLNQAFHAYASAAGFRIQACEGFDPESKGKVEAGVKYVKHNALAGETFADWAALEAHVQQWLDETANVRRHATTGEAPRSRYERDEKTHMRPYLTPAYLSQPRSPGATRQVDKTGLLSWKANKYSAPLVYQQARVGVQEQGTQLVLTALDSGQEIARHSLCQGQGQIIKNTDHYRDKQQQIIELEHLIGQQLGDSAGECLCALLKKTSPRIYRDQLRGLKSLLERYPMPPVLLAQLCERTQLSTTQIRDYLLAYQAHPERLPAPPPTPATGGPAVSKALTPYASLTQCTTEVDHDAYH
jgi:transposase